MTAVEDTASENKWECGGMAADLCTDENRVIADGNENS